MKVSVFDTYVKRTGGKTMHFDILVPEHLNDEEKVFEYGRKYLIEKPFKTGDLSTKECLFCHIELAGPHIADSIIKKGYHIVELLNCK